MWKLFFDIQSDQYCLDRWRLKTTPHQKPGTLLASLEEAVPVAEARKLDMLYVFATADLIPPSKRGQGPDIVREDPRNLIKMDASFFDYVFVSHTGDRFKHISSSLNLQGGRETLFHELGCLLDLIEQKFAPIGFSYQRSPAPATSISKQSHAQL